MIPINIENSTIYCHNSGNLTHTSAIQLDCDKDTIIAFNLESSVYFEGYLKNNWIISKYYHNTSTGHVRRGTGENNIVRIDKLDQYINLDEMDAHCNYHNMSVTKKTMDNKCCVFHGKLCCHLKVVSNDRV